MSMYPNYEKIVKTIHVRIAELPLIEEFSKLTKPRLIPTDKHISRNPNILNESSSSINCPTLEIIKVNKQSRPCIKNLNPLLVNSMISLVLQHNNYNLIVIEISLF